jgi:hypothetical protein
MKQASLAVALVNQVGSFLYLAIYIVVMQHYFSVLRSQPEESWLNHIREWWVTRRSRSEQKRFKVWTQPGSAIEPSPEN